MKSCIKLVGNSEKIISNVKSLKDAKDGDVTFFNNTKYLDALKNSQASACALLDQHKKYAPSTISVLLVKNVQEAYSEMLKIFYQTETQAPYISKNSNIDKSSTVKKYCTIEEGVIIKRNSIIGQNVKIGCNSVIGEEVIIDDNCIIQDNVSLYNCSIGKNCYIGSGSRIGNEGFGFLPNGEKIPHIGRVKICNNVNIGSNTCIDRGVLNDTYIGDGCKIDNLVQIGHNVKLGNSVIIAAQVGIAGSANIGDNVVIGAQSGISNHLNIGKNVKIAGKSGVINDIMDGQIVGGFPAINIKKWHRQSIFLKNTLNKKNHEYTRNKKTHTA